MKEQLLQFKQISAFQDNYIWLFTLNGQAWVVDPGDAAPVIEVLSQNQYTLAGILVTHHHNDHIGGIPALLDWARNQDQVVSVYAPVNESISTRTHSVSEGDQIEIAPGIELSVIEVPGHTAGHIAYYLPESVQNPQSRVFCGDTLFASGCGRLFEGTAEQMSRSLNKLANLPLNTLVCCAHEYTQSNVRFALAVEPNNQDLLNWSEKVALLRLDNQATVPTRLADELLCNPFLRCTKPDVIAAARVQSGLELTDPIAVFAALRSWKDIFK